MMGLRNAASSVAAQLSPHSQEIPREVGRLRKRVAELAEESARMREQLDRLELDLHESRALNRRAAQLLDIVADVLGRPEAAEAAAATAHHAEVEPV